MHVANVCRSAERVAEFGLHFAEAALRAPSRPDQAIESERIPKITTALCGRTT
jgi:hypothetical protein